MAETQHTRRAFIVGAGVAAVGAATAAPAIVQAALPWGREKVITGEAWKDAAGPAIESFRAAYVDELERFALSLEPGFRQGKLRAYDEMKDNDDWSGSPHKTLEALAADRFGLRVTRTKSPNGYERFDGDAALALLVVAVSPHGDAIGTESYHPGYDAQDCVAWDVIRLARERGWYVPSETECGDPIEDMAEIRRHEAEEGAQEAVATRDA